MFVCQRGEEWNGNLIRLYYRKPVKTDKKKIYPSANSSFYLQVTIWSYHWLIKFNLPAFFVQFAKNDWFIFSLYQLSRLGKSFVWGNLYSYHLKFPEHFSFSFMEVIFHWDHLYFAFSAVNNEIFLSFYLIEHIAFIKVGIAFGKRSRE